MAKRKRNIQILFCVSPEEKKLIRRKMIESKTKNMGAYLRKMAIDGYIVNTDTTPLKKQYEEMHKIGVNINQIAKKVNSTGDLYPEEMQELGQQFADEVLKGKYEYVISTHVDKNHIHNHIIFNAASFVDHHKYVSNKRSYHKLCTISNRICHENGLATSMPTGEKVKAIKRTWNIIVGPAGKPNCVLRLIRQSGLPSTMRNFYKKCS